MFEIDGGPGQQGDGLGNAGVFLLSLPPRTSRSPTYQPEVRTGRIVACIDVDDASGLPRSVSVDHVNGTWTVRFVAEFEVEVGGTERRAATDGLEYFDTVGLCESVCTGRPRLQETPDGQTWRVPVAFGDMSAEWLYRFNRHGPALSFGLDFVGEQPVVVRNVVLCLGVDLGEGERVGQRCRPRSRQLDAPRGQHLTRWGLTDRWASRLQCTRPSPAG